MRRRFHEKKCKENGEWVESAQQAHGTTNYAQFPRSNARILLRRTRRTGGAGATSALYPAPLRKAVPDLYARSLEPARRRDFPNAGRASAVLCRRRNQQAYG